MVHGDLALRNLLLTSRHVVKISDFGMSRREDYRRRGSPNGTPLPIYWMAVETLKTLRFTTKSDVWSFGIVLWEMFSLGKAPYTDRDRDFTRFYRWLRRSEENRLGPPSLDCPEM